MMAAAYGTERGMLSAIRASRLIAASAAAIVLAGVSASAADARARPAVTRASRWHVNGSFGRAGVAGLPVREGASGSLLAPGPSGSTFVGGFARRRSGVLLVARMSAAGTLVRGFGGGVVTVPTVHWYSSSPPRLAAAGGGRLLIVGLDGSDRLALVRLTPSGRRDRSFGHGGVATYGFPHRNGFTIPTAATIEPGGKIVVAYQREAPQPVNEPAIQSGLGEGPIELARMLPTGALDPSFGRAGFLSASASTPSLVGYPGSGRGWACAQALAPDGSLALAYEQALAPAGGGSPGPAVEKLGPAGEDAAGFGSHGNVALPFAPSTASGASSFLCDGLFALGDGSVEAAFGGEGPDSTMITLFRFTAGGLLDTAFGASGHVTLGAPVAALAIASGEVFSAGIARGALVISGVLPAGTADPALGGRPGESFNAHLPGGSGSAGGSFELLAGTGSLTIRVGEELVQVSR